MKKILISIITLLIGGFYVSAQELSPFIKVGESQETINATTDKVVMALEDNGFTVLGTYNPAEKSTLKVVAFTRNDIKNTVIKVKDRGALAAVFKIGLQTVNKNVVVSYTNPEYLLRAYLMDNYDTYKTTFDKFSKDLKVALEPIGTEFTPFGGTVKASELKKYHYKIMMPYFTDPVELKEFDSFEQGLTTIQNNLNKGKDKTKLVYKLVYQTEKVAVFGVALQSSEEGEAHFLPIIGESHLAALPYEIILQGKEATMLHGKYRIALFWPDLSMGTFMKIMSTPGDIEDTLEAVTE
jgi:hypothetical protein